MQRQIIQTLILVFGLVGSTAAFVSTPKVLHRAGGTILACEGAGI